MGVARPSLGMKRTLMPLRRPFLAITHESLIHGNAGREASAKPQGYPGAHGSGLLRLVRLGDSGIRLYYRLPSLLPSLLGLLFGLPSRRFRRDDIVYHLPWICLKPRTLRRQFNPPRVLPRLIRKLLGLERCLFSICNSR
jgi:hypothetical protein